MKKSEKIDNLVGAMQNFLSEDSNSAKFRKIVHGLDMLLERHANLNQAIIITDTELTTSQKETLKQKLETRYGKKLDCQFFLDPHIMGGIKVQVNDEIIDLTISSALEQITQALKSQ